MIMVPSKIISKADVELLGIFQHRQALREYDYFSYTTLKDARDAFERDFIVRKLEENNWNISKTSEAIAVERSNLHKKIKTYDITEPHN
jgi:two-component system nitrogen regulation response regulator NtrX